MKITPMLAEHKDEVLHIFKLGIETKNATFETKVPSWETWDAEHLQHTRFVAILENIVVGWVALSPTSKRFCYRGVAEISIYIHTDFAGRGIASKLMQKAIDESEKNGIWTLYSSIFAENLGSKKLHEKFGFRKIGFREKIAKMDGVWRDTTLLERRSEKF